MSLLDRPCFGILQLLDKYRSSSKSQFNALESKKLLSIYTFDRHKHTRIELATIRGILEDRNIPVPADLPDYVDPE